MKKIYSIITSLICSLLCVFGLDWYVKYNLNQNISKAIYDNNVLTRNCSDYAMDRIIDEHSIVVLGSSELSASDELAYPPALFNQGNSDFNMILMGAGYLQSIPQAVNVGALQNNIKNGKIVLIVSPQWFSGSGLTSDAYCSRFEETNFIEFLKNADISKDTKIAVSNRINELLAADEATLMRVQQYESMYLYHTLNPVTYIKMAIYSAFKNAKVRFELVDELKKAPSVGTNERVRVEEINFDALLSEATEIGEEACTNNEFGVYDYYFDQYIRDEIETLKDSGSDASFTVSPEYDDFRLFLDVCKETGIEPLIISVPVNGRWYDYTGFSKVDRNTYYQNIKDICSEYDVRLIDFSDKEYEIYYLKDVMHMGWKGWVYLDKAVYSFYRGEEYNDTTIYEELLDGNEETSVGVSTESVGKYSFVSEAEGDELNAFSATIVENNALIDMTSVPGDRSGVYLHNENSGEYTVRFGVNSNMQDKYVQFKLFLEKGAVYKVKYNVKSINSEQVDIDGLSFSKVYY